MAKEDRLAGQTLFIIRHGEKPVDGDPSPGLTPGGSPDPSSLTVRGWQRAGAWAVVFGSGLGADFPVPDAIYAADPGRSPDDGPPSHRPYQTLIPLSARIGKGTRAHWAQGEEAALAAEIGELDGVTLVCWEHKRIIAGLLPKLLDPATQGVPERWLGHRFDVALRLDRTGPGSPWTFRQLAPRLLGGDPGMPM